MYSRKILILIISFLSVFSYGQKPTKSEILISKIQDVKSNTSRSDDISVLKDILSYGSDHSMEHISSIEDHLGFRHEIFQQYYRGIKVEGGKYKLHKFRGQPSRISGQFINISDLDTNPSIDAVAAKAIALSSAPSSNLVEFDDANRSIELVIYYNMLQLTYHLAYKVDVYTRDPVFRADIYVDAQNGKVLDQIEKIHTTDVEAQGNALYDGAVNVVAQSMEGNYRLRNTLNNSETYSLSNGTDYNAATDISSTDLVFDEDPVAVQAHWGAEQTYQYFMQAHSRNSYDGNGTSIKSYVHYSTDYANAFWDGVRMTYGDGNGTTISPLVSLDVVAHEITHGVTQNSAGLIYKYEAGALNESFSDIFAEAVEYFVRGSND